MENRKSNAVPPRKRTCPICGKKFGGKQGMKAHTASVHAGPVKVNNPGKKKAPSVVTTTSYSIQPHAPRTVVEAGRDIIISMPMKATTSAYVMAALALNPRVMGMPRMASMANLWTQWRIKSMRVTGNCAGVLSSYVSWAMAHTMETETAIPNGTPLERLITSTDTSVQGSSDRSLVLKISPSPWYYVRAKDVKEMAHGQLILACLSASADNPVRVFIDYAIEFKGQTYAEDATAPGHIIAPPPGYSPLFTTSTNSWKDGTKLLIKSTPGAWPTPFYDSLDDCVYEFLGTLKFYDSRGLDSECKYAARIRDMAGPYMAVFASKEAANAYLSATSLTKADQNLLTYNKSGDWSTGSCVFKVVTRVHQAPLTISNFTHLAAGLSVDSAGFMYETPPVVPVSDTAAVEAVTKLAQMLSGLSTLVPPLVGVSALKVFPMTIPVPTRNEADNAQQGPSDANRHEALAVCLEGNVQDPLRSRKSSGVGDFSDVDCFDSPESY